MTRSPSHLSSSIETKGDNYTRLERRNQELWMMKQTRKDLLRIEAKINDSVTCEDFDEDFYEFGETYDDRFSASATTILPRFGHVFTWLTER